MRWSVRVVKVRYSNEAAVMLSDRIERWVRPTVRALEPYRVQNADGMIKLNAMENPYRWPGELAEKWLLEIPQMELNRYPDASAAKLKACLRQVFAIPDAAAIMTGNGSDELIQLLVQGIGSTGDTVLSPSPGFQMYGLIAACSNRRFEPVALNPDDFSLPHTSLLELVERTQPAIVFIAYPNNPTGNLFSSDTLHALLEVAPGVVVVDEAYAPFTDHSFISALGQYENLLVLRTLSKMGLAGIRLGILAGHPQWLWELEKLRLPYNVSVLTQTCAIFALDHIEVFNHQAATICTERARLYQALTNISAVQAWPSEANFILMRAPAGTGNRLHTSIQNRGVLVKNMHPTVDVLADCLRITIGTATENDIFLTALTQALDEVL